MNSTLQCMKTALGYTTESRFLVDLRRIELRSYKVPPRTLHA